MKNDTTGTFGVTTGYIGMYMLIGEITDKKFIAIIAAILFTYIPFLPVHGLAIYGTPMLLWSILYLYRGRHKLWSYFYIMLFSAMSSLVLCGFAWLGVWFLSILLLTASKKIGQHRLEQHEYQVF